MRYLRAVFYFVISLLVTGVVVASLMLYFGTYNVSALQQHTFAVYKVLEIARIRSVKVRSPKNIPDLTNKDWREGGLRLYEQHCKQCHGAPGAAPDALALGMLPEPSPVVKIALERPASDIFWVIKHGIKMSGMPAWKYHFNDSEIWQLVALIQKMPSFTQQEYAQLQEEAAANLTKTGEPPITAPLFDKKERLREGRIALQQYNCTGCHNIPEIIAPVTHLGPPLKGIRDQTFLAGVLPMNPHTLEEWILRPEDFKPGTLMPNLNVTRQHAQLMVEYLFSDEVNHDTAPLIFGGTR